jgi:hypothetical protein
LWASINNNKLIIVVLDQFGAPKLVEDFLKSINHGSSLVEDIDIIINKCYYLFIIIIICIIKSVLRTGPSPGGNRAQISFHLDTGGRITLILVPSVPLGLLSHSDFLQEPSSTLGWRGMNLQAPQSLSSIALMLWRPE